MRPMGVLHGAQRIGRAAREVLREPGLTTEPVAQGVHHLLAAQRQSGRKCYQRRDVLWAQAKRMRCRIARKE